MDPSAAQLNRFAALSAAFAAAADPERAAPMAKYMKDRFEFFGIPSPARRIDWVRGFSFISPKATTAASVSATVRATEPTTALDSLLTTKRRTPGHTPG